MYTFWMVRLPSLFLSAPRLLYPEVKRSAPGKWTSQEGRYRYQHQEISNKMTKSDHSTTKPTDGKSYPFIHIFQSVFYALSYTETDDEVLSDIYIKISKIVQ